MKAIVEIDFGDRRLPEMANMGQNSKTCDVCPFCDYEGTCNIVNCGLVLDEKCFLRENDKVTIKIE